MWTRNSRWQLARDIEPLGSMCQNAYHIVRRVGKQGTRSPRESNQSGVEKCTTESATSLEKHYDVNQAHGDLPAGPSRITPTMKKEKKTKDKSGADRIIKKVM